MAEGSLCDSNLALKLRFGAVASFDFGADGLGVLTEGLNELKDAASNVELLKHVIGVFTLDQFFPSIRLFKNASGFLIR